VSIIARETHNSSLSTACAIDKRRRIKNPSINFDRASRVDRETEAAEVLRLAVLEDLETLDDGFKASLRFLSREFEDRGGFLGGNLFAHDLSWDDSADFEGEESTRPDLQEG
jgi:hypothetical protein